MNRTDKEEDLSFSFTQVHANKLCQLEESLYNFSNQIGKVSKKWLKIATNEDILLVIENCQNAIKAYEDLKQFCYAKSKGGQIYFQDMWECCHNSKNPCFSYIDSTIDLLTELQDFLNTK